MARGEGAEQYSNASLLQNTSPHEIKLAAKVRNSERFMP